MKSSHPLLHLALLSTVLGGARAETCLTSSELAGVIFGSVIGALFVCVGIALILWFFFKKHRTAEQILLFEKAHATQETEDFSESSASFSDKNIGPDYGRFPLVDKYVSASSLFRRRPLSTYQRFLNEHSVQTVPSIAPIGDALRSRPNSGDEEPSIFEGVPLPSGAVSSFRSKFQGLGFDVRDDGGLVVAELHPNSPAFDSGNILIGDRLRKVTVDFENIDVEDAQMLLSFIAPFKITVELERSASSIDSGSCEENPSTMAMSMIVKSSTFSSYPNTIVNTLSPMCLSLLSMQKHSLPMEKSVSSGRAPPTSESESVVPRSSTSSGSLTDYGSRSGSEGKVPQRSGGLARSERLRFDLLPRIRTFSEFSPFVSNCILVGEERSSVTPPPTAVARSFTLRWQKPQSAALFAILEPLHTPFLEIAHSIPLSPRLFAWSLSFDYADSEHLDDPRRGFSLERFSARHRPLRIGQSSPIGAFILDEAFRSFLLSSDWVIHSPLGFCSPLPPSNLPPVISIPEFVEMRVRMIPSPRPTEAPVVERRLPELPASALSPRPVDESESDRLSRLYRSVKRKLRPTSSLLPF
ncbi:hypothetical protein QR680_005613 [Steinernema hermaphroditum]|uniref:PDZ domain-containing protein n=1 Tax=Steinernema hermaphroditum TaxID=289476 RepID=A0AA39HUY1_9BILA|nr:hypothetical protein QR680_005613 [Steinernema hermaphroditum]